MEAFSDATGKRYPSWDALVEAEANGYVAVALMSTTRESWPWVVGPFATKKEAENARNRLRRAIQREERDGARPKSITYKLYVRPAWKDPR